MEYKKESEKLQEQTNSLKVGDNVLTTSGVYGKITEIKFDDSKKVVVLETGGKVKSYLSVDAYAIYTVFKNDAPKPETQKTEKEKVEPEAKEEKKVEEKPEEKVETKKTKAKKVDAKAEEKPKKSKKENK